MPSLPFPLLTVRNLLRKLNYHLSGEFSFEEPFDAQELKVNEEALRAMPTPDAGARAYLDKHIPRLARTLALVPPPQKTSRVLELGCYMQITPLLNRTCGYKEVRGAYYGQPGNVDQKSVEFPDGEFQCEVDHFDVDRDPFPYPDGHFDLVIAGEIIEHLVYDPMHMLVEARRVLADGGYLLVTTPNVGSITSAARALEGNENPQIFALYTRGGEVGHMREYTAVELKAGVEAAGFDVTTLFTTFIADFATYRPLLRFLADNGYDTSNRGEQTWCVARKNAALPVNRFPDFLYTA